jgi:hypothetical protein
MQPQKKFNERTDLIGLQSDCNPIIKIYAPKMLVNVVAISTCILSNIYSIVSVTVFFLMFLLVKRRRKPFSLPELPDLVEYQEEVFEEEEEEDVQKEVFHEYEPEPYSDPAAKKKMTKIVAEIDSRWNKMEPILDDGRMKIWHVHNGGSIHRYESDIFKCCMLLKTTVLISRGVMHIHPTPVSNIRSICQLNQKHASRLQKK